MTHHVWKRTEDNYETEEQNIPGFFSGSVERTEEPGLGYLQIFEDREPIFTWTTALPKDTLKEQKRFRDDMSAIMDAAIELKSSHAQAVK